MKAKNHGMNMTEEDLEELITQKEERLARQQVRQEELQRNIDNNRNNIEQLKYTLQKIKQVRKAHRPSTFIPHQQISDFFTRISRLYDHLLHRLHRSFNYTWFCLVINARYCFESRSQTAGRRLLTPGTILTYFKRERGEF